LLQTADGALWVGGPGTEILRIDYETPRWVTLHDLNFYCEGPTGTRWFLHRDGRVVASEGQDWTTYGVEDDVIDTPVALHGTRRGEIWVAGSHAGTAATARFDGRTWTRFIHDQFSWAVEWRAIFESADGSMWFGAAVDSSGPARHRAGILQYQNGQWIHHHQPGRAPEGADDNDLAVLLPATQRPEPIGKFLMLGESSDGRLWAGRNLVVFRERARWSIYTPPDGVRLGILETMFTTREGDLWVGSRQFGALRYRDGRWESFQNKDQLVANTVRSLAQTIDGSIWAATDRDISRFDGRTWTSNILPAELAVPHESGSLKSSAREQIWINRFPSEWMRRAHPSLSQSGAPATEFWTRGYTYANLPPETNLVAVPATVSQPGNLSAFWSGVAAWREPDLPLQYSFRLDGGAWSPFTTERGQAFFTLAPGRHRLEVRARDRDFNIDPTPAVREFVVLPPVWQQGWFIGLMIACAIVITAQGLRVHLDRAHLRRANRGLAAEVSERQRAEEALRKLNLELDQRVRARTAQLEATNKELEAFSYSVSHDLRAPLRSIDGFSRALLEDYLERLDDEGKDSLQRVRAAAQRMGYLIDDMLALSRVTRDEMSVRPVDLSSLAESIAKELAEREPERRVAFTITPDIVASGDARFLRLALENLLGNAWKFTAKRAEATIGFDAKREDGTLICRVFDNGAGFDMQHAGRLFEAFRRLHADTDYPGTGIGLATVQRIINRHGGRVWAEGHVDVGATVYFTLPEQSVLPPTEI
ncbi:MAG TPA: ATP-binding protein, partial [Candidatus Synoicihabitans sp.]|nr:ATP-binding protein [Candidatus Synoicihabitans sp.]